MRKTPTKPRSELMGYALTALIVIGVLALLGGIVWLGFHPRTGAVDGFGPGWTCHSVEGGDPVCMKTPPVQPPAKAGTRP
jgi:hypothetical protein